MLPLGDFWRGVCRAGAEPWRPGEASVERLCNLGYARGKCSRFPAEVESDAVRFGVSQDDGLRIRLCFVVERDHQPFSIGALEYCRETAEFVTRPEGARGAQAQAFVTSYLRRKREASAK
jgi:hypothetical protein